MFYFSNKKNWLDQSFRKIQSYIILLKFLRSMDSQEINVQHVKIFIGDILKSKKLVEIVIVLENTHLLEKELELDKKEKE